MKWLRGLIVAALCLVPVGAGAWWQSIQQVAISTTPTFQGPGDVFGSAFAFYSVAIAYNAAYANGTNPLADLVDATTGTVAVCTLRIATTGFADLTGAYCVGGLTPATACAAAAGGLCKITKWYDQSGSSRDLIQVTASAMPTITFSSSPSGTLPVVTGPSGTTVMATTGTFTIAQPITLSAVYIRTANFTTAGQLIGANNSNFFIAPATSANKVQINAGTEVDGAATDSAWHSVTALASGSGSNCALNIDGSDTASLACGTGAATTQAIRVLRSAAGTQMNGSIAALGLWSSTSTPTQRNNLCHNYFINFGGSLVSC